MVVKSFSSMKLRKILPGIKILGTDISNHALKNSPKEIRQYLIKKMLQKILVIEIIILI